MKKFKPFNDCVVLQYKEKEQKTKSGIILRLKEQKQDSLGVVVSCGPKVLNLKPNDEVVYNINSGTKTEIEGKEYLVIKEADILLLLE